MWHRPDNCDIIPLAKLQTMKQTNLDPGTAVERRSGAKRETGKRNSGSNRESRASLGASAADKRNSDHLSSPQGRHSLQYSSFRLPAEENSEKYCKHGPPKASGKYLDSGKSSDSSSLSSRHGYRKLQEGGSLRIGSANQNRRATAGDNFRLLQESSSSHNIPHIALPSVNSPTRRGRDAPPMVSKHQSFDMLEGEPSSNGKTSRSLTRSGSFMNSPSRQASKPFPPRRSSIDGGGSDDSMHEKYFKSVENTPVTRRKQAQNSKHSSDSSPQSPLSPPPAKNLVRPSQLVIEAPFSYTKSSPVSSSQQQSQQQIIKKSAERLNLDNSLKQRKSPGQPQYLHQMAGPGPGPGPEVRIKATNSSGGGSKPQSSQNQMEPNRNSLQGKGTGGREGGGGSNSSNKVSYERDRNND